MQEAIETIQQYTAGLDYQAFKSNGMARDAVIRTIQVLGEAANRILKAFRDQHPTVEWMRIIRTRHVLVHDYFGLDYGVIWQIITVNLPPLRESIHAILTNEQPDDADAQLN